MKRVEWMKGTLVFFAVICIMSAFASAADTQFKVQQINASILKGETATYYLTIINPNENEDRFQISTPSSRYIIFVEPKAEITPIGAKSFEKFLLSIKPKEEVDPGPYAVPLKVKSLMTGSVYSVTIPINIKTDNESGVYLPNPSVKLNLPTAIDPRSKLRLDVQLRNRNSRDLSEISIVIDSSLFQKTYQTSLMGMEEKGNELLFDLDPLQKPGTYNVTAKIYFNKKAYAEDTKAFDIIAYNEIKETTTEKKELFKTTTTYSTFNDGNADKTVAKDVKTNFIRNIFITATSPMQHVRRNGVSYNIWTFTLKPQETVSLTTVENYRIPVLIILVIIITVVLYFIIRSPIICYKDVHLKPSKEGVSDIKVKLLVRNRTGGRVSNIKVIDRIPPIAELVISENLGTLAPAKVIHDSRKGTIIRYDIHQLDPFEERIITYNMKSKLKIIGGVSLGPAKIKFETGKGIERKTFSNEIDIKTRHE